MKIHFLMERLIKILSKIIFETKEKDIIDITIIETLTIGIVAIEEVDVEIEEEEGIEVDEVIEEKMEIDMINLIIVITRELKC